MQLLHFRVFKAGDDKVTCSKTNYIEYNLNKIALSVSINIILIYYCGFKMFEVCYIFKAVINWQSLITARFLIDSFP